MPSLSLCLIARDEAELLPGCLASVRGLVDEIVLVDTGSQDGTQDVARREGARVFEQPWRDDFSRARNASVSHARGDWVLVLDADERLTVESHASIRAALLAGGFDCGLVRAHHADRLDASHSDVLAGRARLGGWFRVPRLLRRTPDLAWRGEVHEDLAAWVLAGHPARELDADIVHLGRVPSVVMAKRKGERNLRLLQTRCAREQRDATPFGYLAFELMTAGQLEAAADAADRGWALVNQHPPSRSLTRLAVARGVLQLGAGRPDEAHATAVTAEAFEPGHPDLAYLRAQASEVLAWREPPGSAQRSALLAQATEGYTQALQAADPAEGTFIDGVRSWASLTRLGTTLLPVSAAQARIAFEAALAVRPDHREAMLGVAEAWLNEGQPVQALAAAKLLLDDAPDAWVIASDALACLALTDQSRKLVARAAERVPVGFVGRHRSERLQALIAAAR